MAYLIDEKTFINNTILKYEERMESQYTRFLDKTPSFVTYYAILTPGVTDCGLYNVEQILGYNSPLRFKKITDFPIYGIDSVLLSLSEEDEGLTSNYESEGIILPNTLKPMPNEMFTIQYLDKDYLFMVTSIDYDYIKSNNFYKITFSLRSVTETQKEYLNRQTVDRYTCLFRNIGTEDKAIIKTDDYLSVIEMNTAYKLLADRYKYAFYNKKYNAFIHRNPLEQQIIYDAFLNNFINKHELFNEKFNYTTILMENEDMYESFDFDYDLSLYGIIEHKDLEILPEQIIYTTKVITYIDSIFHYYRIDGARAVTFVPMVDNHDYLDPDLLQRIKVNTKIESDNVLHRTLIDFFNDNIKSFSQIEFGELRHLHRYFTVTFENYLLVPIILYILREYYFGFIKNNQNK